MDGNQKDTEVSVMKKFTITLPEVLKNHLKVIGYLVLSSVLGYVLSVVTQRPEGIYAIPIINYILFAIKQELDKTGVIQAVKNQ